ncbi:DNA-binding response regulator [Nocardioides sp. GCM10027113]|uniref:DNA-binding response regulator n=1 Tax=unclassified Nocardioides TaxID=2615069 RepID=UPI00361B317A
MPRSTPSSVLSALGLDREEERLYQRAVPLSGSDLEMVAAAFGVDRGELPSLLAPLVGRGIARLGNDRLTVLSLAEVVASFVRREADAALETRERLTELAEAVPFLTAAATRPGPGDVESVAPLDGEISSGGNPLQLLTNLIQESRGDLLWLRPDAYLMPRESAVSEVVAEAIASGRRSRAIYPVRALQEAPEALAARARAGEQVRVIADLPTRLIVIGTTHAVVPEPLGMSDQPRLLVRQRALVEAMTMLFELMWERAAPVPDLDFGEARPDLRRFLLQQLAAGAKDEQIARTLGISLRTVRRRVAGLLIELGVDSRFQAGVEAVRRGWL